MFHNLYEAGVCSRFTGLVVGVVGVGMLSEAEKTDARRFMGYPAHGSDPAGNTGWQYFQAYGAVEFRLGALSDAELVVMRRFLGTLATLEQAIPGMSPGLDTDGAAGWKRNPAELSDRVRLFEDWCRRLCGFLGVPAGPGLGSGASSSVALVV